MPARVFHPERGENTRLWVSTAKAVCAGCPVREECLEAGMREPRGVWGGLTARERVRLRHERRADVAV